MSDVYFANLPEEDIARELLARVEAFYQDAERTGRLALWQRSHRQYFSMNAAGYYDAAKIRGAGEAGALSVMRANHYRNLLQHLLVLATQNRPAWDCRARNTDVKSQVQTVLGRNVLEYYMRAQRLEQKFREGVEIGIVYGDATFELEWDELAGAEYAGDPSIDETIRVGDVRLNTHEPINTIRPIYNATDRRAPWYIFRTWENKYDLAARYPDKSNEILSIGTGDDLKTAYYTDARGIGQDASEDFIPLFRFYHDRTPACADGRFAEFLADGTVLSYSPLIARHIPVYPMVPQRQHGSHFGFSVAFDLLVVQEGIDLLYSTVLSNQATFGVQNVWVKPGTNLTPLQLGGGLNLLESVEKPEAINLTSTPAEIFKFLEGLEKLGEVLSGVNAVARGQPEASLKSGAALALVAAQAVQFSNGLQAAFVSALEDVGTAIIQHLQDRAVLPRVAAIAGKSNQAFAREFTGKDLIEIDRVIVDVGNPVARTLAGRIQMAQDLLQAQVIQQPEEYLQVIETGSVDTAVEAKRNVEFTIDAENEALRMEQPVVAIVTDMHQKHILGHASVLGGPSERMDHALVQRTLKHIQEHIQLLRTTDPALLNVLGQAPIQPAAPPQGAQAPQPNAKSPETAGPQPQGGMPQPGQQVQGPQGTPPEVQAQMPKMPEPPAGPQSN